jgi:hypothetical protein
VSTLTRNIEVWWPVNCSTSPKDPAQTAVSFAALKITNSRESQNVVVLPDWYMGEFDHHRMIVLSDSFFPTFT